MDEEYHALISNGTWKFNADGSMARYKARLVANGKSQQIGIDCDETFSPGFQRSRCDSSLFVYHHGSSTSYLLLYVDDIILTASSTSLLQTIIGQLSREFSMTDLGDLNYFLGISATCSSTGMFLSQKNYSIYILKHVDMVHGKPYRTPTDTLSKLDDTGPPVADPTLYRSFAGALQYLTFTRPDISYVVQQICLFMHDLREPHFLALKCILRYLRGTLDHGLQIHVSSTDGLVAYSDADWDGCPTTHRFTSGYCVFLCDNLLSWSSKHHEVISRSSAEAEYQGVANVVAETCCNVPIGRTNNKHIIWKQNQHQSQKAILISSER
ncbi:uncharacterized mitochondrial protein AtMg00810-like [Rutidosis leptorrhynchoides]|uniref:uncharacterized mitochondrial protein AtMg00810-like n=1 Tax=Rutidosis leptorrhynchoides TaxID=125765 RepID=UPI003A992DE3